ncbi:hypothetical protein ABE10_01745, partial [Bacillus toyonensis]|nr:hypothetical protein [Bacillus toyonensis]
ARLERCHRALTLLLAHIAVHAPDVEAAIAQLVHEPLRRALGTGEDDGLASSLGLQDAGDDLVLVERVSPVDEMADVGLREPFVGIVGPDVDRVRHEPAGQGHDRARHRRAEQLGVADRRDLLEDLLDIGEEAEVEHLVRLVENDLRRVREIEEPLPCEIDQTAGRADHDLRAGLELLDLTFVGLAAVDRDDVRGAPRGQQVHVLVHLDGELAGGDDDQRLDTRRRVLAESLHDGDSEAEGLAGAGLRLTDDVLAGKPQRDRLLLDGEGIHDALRRESVDDVLIDAEIGECRHVFCKPVRQPLARSGSASKTDPRRFSKHRRGAPIPRRSLSRVPEEAAPVVRPRGGERGAQ